MSTEGDPIHPSTLQITIDPRIELLAVVQYLAGYGQHFPLLTPFDIRYKTEIEAGFHPFRDHQAVKLFDQMSDHFHADAPPAVMLHLSVPPELKVQVPFTNYLLQRAGGLDRLGQFIAALRDFAQLSRFMDFYLAHSAFYETVVQDATAQLTPFDDVAVLENYFGMRQHSYTLIIAPLFNPAGYGPRVCRKDGTFDLYCITGSSGMDDQHQPLFGGWANLRSLLWHEFSHSFVNPLTEQYLREVNRYQALYPLIAEQMTQYGYDSWEITVKEHIVRAITIRMATHELSIAEGCAFLERELTWGFAYIDRLVQCLKQYETQRNRYPSFRDFYLELIQGFAEADSI